MNLPKERKFEKITEPDICMIATLETLNTAEEELWCLLDRLTNKAQANDFLYKTLGHKKGIEKNISPILSEFIKQGKAYYIQAEKADPKISPLLYYYGMLNLVKAYIISRNPFLLIPRINKKFLKSNLSHGISDGEKIKPNYSIHNERIELKNAGVFSNFYNLIMETKISSLEKSKKQVSITTLLSYCYDISSEFEEVFRSKKNSIPLQIQIARENNKAWIRLIILKENFTKSLTVKKFLLRNLGLVQYKRVKSEYKSYYTFEEKNTFSFSNEKNLQSQIRKRIKPLTINFSSSAKGTSYSLSLEDSNNPNILLPEILNIYLIMYYLGSVVRYQPYVLKNILPLKEGWVIQSFIKTCPKKFLRLIVGRIFDKHFVFTEI